LFMFEGCKSDRFKDKTFCPLSIRRTMDREFLQLPDGVRPFNLLIQNN